MFRRFSVNFAIFSMILDGAMVCLALLAATYLRPALFFLPFAAEFPKLIPTPILLYPVFALEWIAIHLLFNVYDGKRNIRPVDEFISLSLAALLATVALAGTLYLSYRDLSRLLFLSFILFTYLEMLGWRAIVDLISRHFQAQAHGIRRVLIAGAGLVGRELQSQIINNPHLHLEVIGFLDDDPSKQTTQPDMLGNLDDAPVVVQAHQIDDIVIALPQRAYQRLNLLVSELIRLPVRVWVIPDYFRLALHQASIELFAGIPMLDLRAPALSD